MASRNRQTNKLLPIVPSLGSRVRSRAVAIVSCSGRCWRSCLLDQTQRATRQPANRPTGHCAMRAHGSLTDVTYRCQSLAGDTPPYVGRKLLSVVPCGLNYIWPCVQPRSLPMSNLLFSCKISGFHGGDYEECRLLGHKNPVRTSQETHYPSTKESSQLMLCNI
jgi:hypothetical protein